MKATVVREFGGIERLELVDVPEPVAGPGQVVVEVEAAGVNYADVMMRRGLYVGGPPPPFVPGLEVAGRVAERKLGTRLPEEGLPLPPGSSARIADDRLTIDLGRKETR